MSIGFSVKFIVVIVFLEHSIGARIFGYFPTPSISHQVVFRALMEELARRGHELVVVTPDPVHYKEEEFKNFTEIDVHEKSYQIWRDKFNFVKSRFKDPSPLSVYDIYMDVMPSIIDEQLSHPTIVKMLQNSTENFDLCIVEGLLPINAVFKDKFKCPLILINSLVGLSSNFDIVGSPTHPILYSDIFNPYDSSELDIWKKIEILKYRLEDIYITDWKYAKKHQECAEKHFGSNLRPIKEIEAEADMVFQNFHPIFAGVRPLVPAVIHLGSMHLKPPKPLPLELKTIMDDAKNGVIYFSFGSNVRSSDLPDNKVNELLETFRNLPYTVLWKWETDDLPNKPRNVFINKWYPQDSVLAHPNVRLFITQGGQQSLEEAIHFGVPLIGIPFLADQSANVVRIVKFGIGRRLLIETLNSKDISDAITNVITNTSYVENIKKLKILLNDEPQTPLERAVWWTEYVIRHGGAKHLRSPGANMSFLEYYFIYDILKILSVLTALVVFVARIFRKLLNKTMTVKKHKKL